jgi:hypothetical protein
MPGGGRGGDPAAGGGDEKKKPARETWRPIGEIALSIFGEGGGGAPGFPGRPPMDFKPPPNIIPPGGKGPPMMPGGDPKFDPKAQPAKEVVARTEFVILFIWREPVVAGKAAEKKE